MRDKDNDIITVAMEIGKSIFVNAKGDPARTVSYALVAGGAVLVTAMAYGSYKYGNEALKWVKNR